ncbi:Hok/Gef family protein [Serratia bockelmannii]|uniref:Hok/Gef family protein n=1 Tax=Serratia TaxID=613 RepID=UPI000949661D|nr:Hok/Gef family protein [Serratia sp. 506_PEND]
MSRKLLLYGLIVVCLTLLAFTWMVRGSLCEIRVQQGNTEFAAFLNYEVRS